jgi:hypothetical protein
MEIKVSLRNTYHKHYFALDGTDTQNTVLYDPSSRTASLERRQAAQCDPCLPAHRQSSSHIIGTKEYPRIILVASVRVLFRLLLRVQTSHYGVSWVVHYKTHGKDFGIHSRLDL